MKKQIITGLFFVMLNLFTISTLFAQSKFLAKYKNFSEFSLEDDLAWLEGTWDLTSWKTDNHGKIEDNTKNYGKQFLRINGNLKTSSLIEETTSANFGKINKEEYTIESYFLKNNHQKGNANYVNTNKTQILLSRESDNDPEVIAYFLFTKKISKNPYEDNVVTFMSIGNSGEKRITHIDHNLLRSNLKDMETSLIESKTLTNSNNLEKFYKKQNIIMQSYENENLYKQYDKLYSTYKECIKIWDKEQKLLGK